MNSFIAHIEEGQGVLTPEESWHCARVLRSKPGEHVRLIDGLGKAWEAELSLVSDKQCVARLLSDPLVDAPRPYSLHLAIAPTKQIDRMEWLAEKAVEIGIDVLSFMQCKNSERTVVKTDRIKKIVESAVKQSLQARIPVVNELLPFKKILECRANHQLIAHCFEGPKSDLRHLPLKGQSVLVLIGPEGDFTSEEIKQATEAGFNGLSLGSHRLRTETAGLYVCQALSLLA